MTMTAADHTLYLAPSDKSESVAEIEKLRQCLLEIFANLDDMEAIRISGLLIEYGRDYMLPALGAIRRNATANSRAYMSVAEIMSATGLSYAVVSRLITENRGTLPR